METTQLLPDAPSQGTAWKERLSGFALSHVLISVFGFLAGLFALALSDLVFIDHAFQIGGVVLPLLYAVAGFWMAWEHNWSRPATFREGLLDFLRPALIAWAWGGLLLVSMFLHTGALGVVMIYMSIALASPSTVLVFCAAMLGILNGGIAGYLLTLFLAGGIPPLLFLLGSLLGSRSKKKKEEERSEEG